MNRKELTNTFMMISNWKKTLWLWWFFHKLIQRFKVWSCNCLKAKHKGCKRLWISTLEVNFSKFMISPEIRVSECPIYLPILWRVVHQSEPAGWHGRKRTVLFINVNDSFFLDVCTTFQLRAINSSIIVNCRYKCIDSSAKYICYCITGEILMFSIAKHFAKACQSSGGSRGSFANKIPSTGSANVNLPAFLWS